MPERGRTALRLPYSVCTTIPVFTVHLAMSAYAAGIGCVMRICSSGQDSAGDLSA